jgi:hypothetical protein
MAKMCYMDLVQKFEWVVEYNEQPRLSSRLIIFFFLPLLQRRLLHKKIAIVLAVDDQAYPFPFQKP